MLIGIDLGTTNSAVAIWRDDRSELVPNALGEVLTPSAVSIDRTGQVWTGTAALDRMATHPEETVTSFKRMMGTEASVKLGKREYRAEELSALILSSLVDDVAQALGERPAEAVITVPAYFNEKQRRATRRAGEIAGLEVRRLINEPTAAALAYGLQDRDDREPFLVFDLGGGTFDVSIVEMFEGIVEVRASAGDNRLGGDDFNAVMVQMAEGRLGDGAKAALDALPSERRHALLTLAAEKARRTLSDKAEAEFTMTVGDERFAATITGEEFEEEAKWLIKRLRDPVIRSLRDTGINVKELSEVVLVGGATRMPVVRKALTRMFGRFPNHSVHPDHAVALGAAVQAGLLAKDGGLDEIRITDVAPFTLGVDTADRDNFGVIHSGIFSPIIERNTPVPVSRVQYYSTMQDNQREVEFNVFQGEARDVKNNVKLGTVRVNVPPKPAGHIAIEIRFTYDTNGLLEIDVEVPETGLKKNLVIVDEEDGRSAKDIEASRKALEKLKVHPRDEAENVAAMTRAERCYEGFTGPARLMIGEWITEFQGALEKQDPRVITDARAQLLSALDQLEANPPL